MTNTQQTISGCLIAGLVGLLASCTNKPQEADLVLLYTTDLHGAVLPFDINRNTPAKTSLANVCSYIKEQRNANPDAIMLFDTGDYLQGQPSMYYYNYVELDKAHIMTRAFSYLQYDAVGMGNHDIETGEPNYGIRLKKEFSEAGIPLICANAIDVRTGKSMFQPYAIINRKGIKIAILGLITPNIAAWLPKQLWPNLEFQDMVESAQYWVPIIQKEENPDLLIGLFHAGGDYTANGCDMDTYKNENGSIPVATKVPGFDIILCGHDHRARQTDIVNVNGDTVKVFDARTQAAVVGRADIHLSRLEDGSYKKTITTELIPMEDVTPDPEYCEVFNEDLTTVNNYVDAKVGELTGELKGRPSLFGPSEFIDFIHNVQLWATKADISMASVLSPHDVIPAGEVTMRTLFTLYKYENKLFSVRMTGAEVHKYLEFGFARQFNVLNMADLARYKKMDNNVPTLLATGKTPTFNYTSAAGIKYTVDITKPEGQKVTILSMSDGTPFDPDKSYLVAINSYQACGGGQFIPEGLGWDDETLAKNTVLASDLDVRHYVAEYIRANSPVTPALRGDWKVIPEDLFEAARNHNNERIDTNRR